MIGGGAYDVMGLREEVGEVAWAGAFWAGETKDASSIDGVGG